VGGGGGGRARDEHGFFGVSRGPIAKFIVPDLGDKVKPGVGLSYRPDMRTWLAGKLNGTQTAISPAT
jgi:hypothetical protein